MEQTEIERARTSIKDYRKGYGQPQLHTDCIIQLMMGHSKRELSQLQAKHKEAIKQAVIEAYNKGQRNQILWSMDECVMTDLQIEEGHNAPKTGHDYYLTNH